MRTAACVVILSALAVGMLWAVRVLWLMERGLRELAPDAGAVAIGLLVLALLYAVALAAALLAAWRRLAEAQQGVEAEATALVALLRVGRSLAEPARDQLTGLVQTYAEAVVDDEWPRLAQRQASPRAGQHLDKVWAVLGRIEPHSPRETALLAELLRRYEQAVDGRARRLLLGRTALPPGLWALLAAGGLLLVVGLTLLAVQSGELHGLLVGGLTALLTWLLCLLHDLDRPFDGGWSVSPVPFLAALRPHES